MAKKKYFLGCQRGIPSRKQDKPSGKTRLCAILITGPGKSYMAQQSEYLVGIHKIPRISGSAQNKTPSFADGAMYLLEGLDLFTSQTIANHSCYGSQCSRAQEFSIPGAQ